jgi:hypothetical protein
MPEFFRLVVDNEGKNNYEPVEVIPEEVVYQHPAYRQVVDESVGRRKTIGELKAEIEQLKSATAPAATPAPAPVVQQPATPAPVPTPAPETPKFPSIDEIYEQVVARQVAEREQASQLTQQFQTLLTENGLDASYLPLLENAKDPKKAAEELGRKKLSFAEGGVNPEKGADPSTMFTRINKNMGLK